MKDGAQRGGRAVAYLRVSTDDQYEGGSGLHAQLDACTAWAAREGRELVGPFEEHSGVSGSTPVEDRPGLVEAVAALRRGDVLLVAKRDRLMRNVGQMAVLESLTRARGARLVSAAGEGTEAEDPDDPGAFLQRTFTDAFAHYERLVIRVRTVMAMRARRARGERNGQVPYGTDLVDDGRRSRRSGGRLPIALAANDRERAGIDLILSSRAEGLTFRAIALRLEARGFRTKAGKPFRHSSVAFLYHYHSKERSRESTASRPTPRGPEASDPLRPTA